MAAEMSRVVGVKARLVPGSGGVFDVVVDGETIFSKAAVGRFPEPGEVSRLLRAH